MAIPLARKDGWVRAWKARRPWLGRLLRNRKAVVGAVVLAVVVLAALLAGVISPHNPYDQNLRQRLQGPSREHWLGTDQFGRDLFSRIVHGARISLSVGFVSVGIALLLGGSMGLVAGYYSGRIENVLMRLADVLMALPAFLLALAIVATLGPSLTNVMVAVGIALGLGAQPPTPEWGSMLNSARPFIRAAHHVVTYPGLAIMITTLSLNLVGDGLRDALDPRMRE